MIFIYRIVRIVPNYELAPDLEKVDILRVVVRENMSEAVRPSLPFSLHPIILTLHNSPYSSSTAS